MACPFLSTFGGLNSASCKGVSVRCVGRETLADDLYGRKELTSYLTVRSKIFIQSYATRMDWPTKEMGVPFLPPGII